MRMCRDCEQWYSSAQWRGNCKLHPWDNDRWSETCEPSLECKGKDFVDKYAKYQVAQREETKPVDLLFEKELADLISMRQASRIKG